MIRSRKLVNQNDRITLCSFRVVDFGSLNIDETTSDLLQMAGCSICRESSRLVELVLQSP